MPLAVDPGPLDPDTPASPAPHVAPCTPHSSPQAHVHRHIRQHGHRLSAQRTCGLLKEMIFSIGGGGLDMSRTAGPPLDHEGGARASSLGSQCPAPPPWRRGPSQGSRPVFPRPLRHPSGPAHQTDHLARAALSDKTVSDSSCRSAPQGAGKEGAVPYIPFQPRPCLSTLWGLGAG